MGTGGKDHLVSRGGSANEILNNGPSYGGEKEGNGELKRRLGKNAKFQTTPREVKDFSNQAEGGGRREIN